MHKRAPRRIDQFARETAPAVGGAHPNQCDAEDGRFRCSGDGLRLVAAPKGSSCDALGDEKSNDAQRLDGEKRATSRSRAKVRRTAQVPGSEHHRLRDHRRRSAVAVKRDGYKGYFRRVSRRH